jgi:hypothetical protein
MKHSRAAIGVVVAAALLVAALAGVASTQDSGEPDLGPAVVVTPGPSTSRPAPTTTTARDGGTPVEPSTPPRGGDDDGDDDDDDDGDD